MKKSIAKYLFYAIAMIGIISCSNDDESSLRTALSSEKEIAEISVSINNESFSTILEGNTFVLEVPVGTNLSSVIPTLTIPNKATVTPASGTVQDLREPVRYTVTAEDGSNRNYILQVTFTEVSAQKEIISLNFNNVIFKDYKVLESNPQDIDTIIASVPFKTDLTQLTSEIAISPLAEITPQSGELLDYSSPVKYTVTAQDGSTKEYVVLVDNSLSKVRILNEDEILNVSKTLKPGDNFEIKVDEIGIEQELTVELRDWYNDNKKASLKITAINTETNVITVKTPDNYLNSIYRIFVSVAASNNFLSNKVYTLSKGRPTFAGVDFTPTNGGVTSVNSLLSPGDNFDAVMILDEDKINDYQFYLKQNQRMIPLVSKGTGRNVGSTNFDMPNLSVQNFSTAEDYFIGIKIDGTTFEYPFASLNTAPFDGSSTNRPKNLIKIVVAKDATVTGLDTTTIKKGDTFTVIGTDLFYPLNSSSTNLNLLADKSTVILTSTTDNSLSYTLSGAINRPTQVSFTTPEEMQSGTYQVNFKNNVTSFSVQETLFTLTVLSNFPTHPTIKITEAKLFDNNGGFFDQQVNIKFNTATSGMNFNGIFFANEAFEIGSFLVNPSSILTGRLSSEQVTQIKNMPEGFVLITENNVQYAIPFSIIVQQ